MIDHQLKIADNIVSNLFENFPNQVNTPWGRSNYKKVKSVLNILIDEGWILESGSGYKLNPKAISVYEKHKSYSNTVKYQQAKIQRQEKKEIFDFHVSKWKYHTFWWFFALAIFGGGYSAYDLISNLTTKEYVQPKQIPIEEKESVRSKSHILILDQKNSDSLHNSKAKTSISDKK